MQIRHGCIRRTGGIRTMQYVVRTRPMPPPVLRATSSLKKAAQDHLAKVEAFLAEAFTKLELKPETIDEIGQANQFHAEMRPGRGWRGMPAARCECVGALALWVRAHCIVLAPCFISCGKPGMSAKKLSGIFCFTPGFRFFPSDSEFFYHFTRYKESNKSFLAI